MHVEIKIVNKEAATKRSTLLQYMKSFITTAGKAQFISVGGKCDFGALDPGPTLDAIILLTFLLLENCLSPTLAR